MKALENIWVSRLLAFLFSAALILGGVQATFFGDLHYRNYWGGLVFGPFAILIGLFPLVLVVFKWKTLNGSPPNKKHRGREARRARKAAAVKYPIDDFQKW